MRHSVSRLRSYAAFAALASAFVGLLAFSARAAEEMADIRIEFCQNGNVSNTLTFDKGATIPASICVRYTNLSSTSVSIKSELVDGYLMADGRRACRENDEAKTTFAKTARFKVGSQMLDTVSVTINPNASVEAQISPGFSSVSSALYGCVVAYGDSTSGAGISVVTRRGITLGFGGAAAPSGSNITDSSTGITATGTTATGTTATGTTATGTTATGTAVPTSQTGATEVVPAIQAVHSSGGIIGSPDEAYALEDTTAPETEDLPMLGKSRLDPELFAIIRENPVLASQIRAAGARDSTLAVVASAIDAHGASSGSAEDSSPCAGYGDLSSGNEFCGYIRILSTKEIVRKSSEFEPGRSITRAELLKIVMLASKLTPSYNPSYTYTDVAASDWWAPYVSTAKKYGYISQTNSEFRPNDSITRAEAIKILMNVSGRTASYNPSYTYTDVAASDWWAPYVSTAKKYGYISQTNSEFRPNDSITRAESSKMVVMMTAERLLFE